MPMQADNVQSCEPENGDRPVGQSLSEHHLLALTAGTMFLYILPSFIITTKFLAGSAISWMFSSGLPSTSRRSARAPSSTTPSLPAYGLRFPDIVSSWALVPVAMASVSAGVYQRTSPAN